MTTRFGNKMQATLLVASVLMVSACASIKAGDSNKSGATVADKADEATRTTIAKGKFETPPEIQLSSVKKSAESANSYSEAVPDTAHPSQLSSSRINQKEASVNVRSTPSAKSRSIAVLTAGQPIEVMETRDSWVRITWLKGDTVKQGWLKKAFVEGN